MPGPVGFLTDAQGVPSAMRLMCCTAMAVAIVFGAVVVLGKGGPDGFAVVIAFLGAAMGGKTAQKFAEQRAEQEGR
jgi:hypothetical protein